MKSQKYRVIGNKSTVSVAGDVFRVRDHHASPFIGRAGECVEEFGNIVILEFSNGERYPFRRELLNTEHSGKSASPRVPAKNDSRNLHPCENPDCNKMTDKKRFCSHFCWRKTQIRPIPPDLKILYENGMKISQLVKHFKAGRHTIRKWLDELGFPRQRRSKYDK